MFENLDVLSAGVALLSLLLSLWVMRRQATMQYESLRAQLDADVLAWAQETIDVLAEASALANGRGGIYQGEEFLRVQSLLAQRLSALTDRGRLFFPNEIPDKYGQHQFGAFQGVRPPILDALVFACCQTQNLNAEGGPDHDVARFLNDCRRLAVSEAQNAINPRRRKQMLDALTEGRKDDATPSEVAVARLHAALAARFPDVAVVTEWAKSRAFMRDNLSPPAG